MEFSIGIINRAHDAAQESFPKKTLNTKFGYHSLGLRSIFRLLHTMASLKIAVVGLGRMVREYESTHST